MGKERELRRGSATEGERLGIQKQTWKHKVCLKLMFISVYSTKKIMWKDRLICVQDTEICLPFLSFSVLRDNMEIN